MKNKLQLSVTICLLSMVLSLPLCAVTNFIVIDTQKVVSESKVFNHVQTQLNKFAMEMQNEYSEKEAVLKKEYDEILASRNNYSPKVWDEKIHDIQNRVKTLQDHFTIKKQNFDKLSADASKTIEDKIKGIVLKLAKDMKIDTIFQGYSFVGGIYPADKDKTEQVKKMLDLALPKIDLKKP